MLVELNGRRYEVDEHGFLREPSIWNREVALDLASSEGLTELSPDHWKVVTFLRGYYEQYGIAPTIRKLCAASGLKLRQIYALFPSGPAMGACKVAGLDKPDGCV